VAEREGVRRDELERTLAALEATTQISRAAGGEADDDAILRLIAERGRELVDARSLMIERLEGRQLILAAGAGELPEGMIGQGFDSRGTVAEVALETRRPQRLETEANRARFVERGLGRLGVEAHAGLVAPLVFRGNTYGVLVALDRRGDEPEFTVSDERLLEAFAVSAATALATARSAAASRLRQRMAATDEERRRWARELHDETLQGLGALQIRLTLAAGSDDLTTLQSTIDGAVEQLENDITSLRELISELRPAELDELGAEAAIRTLAERAGGDGLIVDSRIDLAFEMGRESTRHVPDVESTTYRIVQEALNNARRHAEATRVRIEVNEDSESVWISVRDDGHGFDVETATKGFGLLGMRERADLVDGELEIDSATGRGTEVRARLPALRREP